MLYAIISEDIENSLEKRLSARPKHLERLEALKSENRLFWGPGPIKNCKNPIFPPKSR